jgi:hypothetical protein
VSGIVISSKQLRSRDSRIRAILRPIARVRDGPWCAIRSIRRDYLIGAFDSHHPLSHPREWRFATFVPGIRAAYYETWRRADGDSWYLVHAYLNMYRLELATAEEKGFVSLHCDPDEAATVPHASYKRGPHLNVEAADYPFPRAHLCVAGGDLAAVLASESSLRQAMAWAVTMLKDEVLSAMVPWVPTG